MLIMTIRTEESILKSLEALGDKITPFMELEIGQYLANDDLPAATYLIEIWEAKFAEDL
jgi:hypothetical protein